jgi:hypothetical protein
LGAAIQQQLSLLNIRLRHHQHGCAAGFGGRIRVETLVERLAQLGRRTEERRLDPWLVNRDRRDIRSRNMEDLQKPADAAATPRARSHRLPASRAGIAGRAATPDRKWKRRRPPAEQLAPDPSSTHR